MKAMICSPENLMGMRSERSSGPSRVSQTVAELGFEPRTGYGNPVFVFHSFFFFLSFFFLNFSSLQCCLGPGIDGLSSCYFIFKAMVRHYRILFCGSYLRTDFWYDILT